MNNQLELNTIIAICALYILSVTFISDSIWITYAEGQLTELESGSSFEKLLNEEASIEPLKIMLQLEKDTEFGDSPLRFDITEYSFEMEGLQQGDNKNYELVTDGMVTGNIIVHPTNIVLSYIGTLEVVNKTGDMTETDIRDVGGIVMVDKILENAEKTVYIFDTSEQGFVEVGDQMWDNVTGNITMTSDNNGIMAIEAGAQIENEIQDNNTNTDREIQYKAQGEAALEKLDRELDSINHFEIRPAVS